MAIIAINEVAGIISDDGGTICSECMTQDQWDNLKYSQVLTTDHIENDDENIYLCCACDNKL